MSVSSHKGQILPIANQLIPIDKETTFHANYDHSLSGLNQGQIIRPIGPEKGLRFNGTSYLDCGTSTMTSNQFTIEFWLKNESTSSYNSVISSNNALLIVIETTQSISFRVPGIEETQWGTDASALTNGVWHHVACVYDGNNQVIYIDGVERARKTATSGTVTLSNLKIGHSSNAINYHTGEISELRIWKTAKTQEQLQENMSKQVGHQEDLYAYYKLNETEGPISFDQSANGNDAIWNGTLTSVEAVSIVTKTEGRFGNAISIESSNGLKYPSSLLNYEEGTLSFWGKLSYALPFNPGGLDYLYMSTSVGYSEVASLNFCTSNNSYPNRVIGVNWAGENGGPNHLSKELNNTPKYNNGDWNMYTITWNKDRGYSLYINGVLAGNGASNLPLKSFDTKYLTIKGMTIDELRIESRQITPDEALAWAVGGPHYNYLDY